MFRPRPGLLVLLLALPPIPAGAQERFVLPRLTGPIVLDGRVDEPAWLVIAPLPAVTSSPTFGAAPSERTELRLAYDDQYLYASGRFFDTDPAGIRATSLRRDEGSFSNDWLALNLDTFRDRETTLVFGTNPAGIRTDAVFSNDAAQAPSFTWNSFWDARVSRDSSGWFAEIRIPLASLRYEVVNGEVVIGATIWRRIARKNENIAWPAIPQDWGAFSIFKATRMAEVVLTGVHRRNPAYLTPYLLGGAARAARLNPARDAWQLPTETTREAGLDAKFTPGSNLTVDLTVNTDFAQVEADDQQVNLTRFSLFFPERRLFFQERAAAFEYSLGGNEQLFYSRRIGLVDGAPVRLYGGARVVGRVEGWDVAALTMQSAAAGSTGSENSGVVRLRRQVLNSGSYAGALTTTRFAAGHHNVVLGGDLLIRAAANDYLSLQVARSWDGGDTLASSPDRWLGRARWEKRGNYGLTYHLEGARVGERFLPALGFLSRSDFRKGSARAALGWRGPDGSSVLRQQLSLTGTLYHHETRRLTESADLTAEWQLESRQGRILALSATGRYDDLAQPFSVGRGVSVPAGLYRFVEVQARHESPASDPFRIVASVTAGSFYDGGRISSVVSPTWFASVHLQLNGTWQVNHLRFPTREVALTTHLARLRAQIMVDSRISAVAFVQYNSATDALAGNLRFRYNPAEGHDLYLVYNHGLNTDRDAASPARPFTDNQALLIKYSRTITIGQ